MRTPFARIAASSLALVVVLGVPAYGLRQAATKGIAVISSLQPKLDRAADLTAWDLDGSGAWEIANHMLVLSKAGVPAGSLRRPAALAILKASDAPRVTIEADIRSTAPVDVANRDLELVFDYQSPTRFYYVHLAGITNDVHNGVFLVADADRKRIDAGTTPAQLTDQQWHHVRLERDDKGGRIQVFVDRAERPAWDIVDKTLSGGRVGLGSFDDTGEFRSLVVTRRTER